jgi:hypothetical protein
MDEASITNTKELIRKDFIPPKAGRLNSVGLSDASGMVVKIPRLWRDIETNANASMVSGNLNFGKYEGNSLTMS